MSKPSVRRPIVRIVLAVSGLVLVLAVAITGVFLVTGNTQPSQSGSTANSIAPAPIPSVSQTKTPVTTTSHPVMDGSAPCSGTAEECRHCDPHVPGNFEWWANHNTTDQPAAFLVLDICHQDYETFVHPETYTYPSTTSSAAPPEVSSDSPETPPDLTYNHPRTASDPYGCRAERRAHDAHPDLPDSDFACDSNFGQTPPTTIWQCWELHDNGGASEYPEEYNQYCGRYVF